MNNNFFYRQMPEYKTFSPYYQEPINFFMQIQPGQKFYYPAEDGIALICQVMSVKPPFLIIAIEDSKYKIHQKSFQSYAIPLNPVKSQIYISQKLYDPDNKIIYLRHRYDESLIDKFYNWYCKKKNRVPHVLG